MERCYEVERFGRVMFGHIGHISANCGNPQRITEIANATVIKISSVNLPASRLEFEKSQTPATADVEQSAAGRWLVGDVCKDSVDLSTVLKSVKGCIFEFS
jgi:hypothetical protein